ncbi:MAG: Asp23/Gls24 family envelope stress response protein [Puniceicoccales bacterium]|jgi:uncharacterized alkaline shock family protein YloU|nr:Asp23/Gls24 family envelope stress response protein [Puniceicoccales bacterium]
MTTEKSDKKEKGKNSSFPIPMVSDDSSCNLGEIKINHSVIANIATLSAMQTKGVLAVGKHGFANGIASFFSSKKSTLNGVNISEDEFGNYLIDICLTLKFGCELAKVASNVQQNIIDHITKMTMTGVSKVNIIIDGVEISETTDKNEFIEGEL